MVVSASTVDEAKEIVRGLIGEDVDPSAIRVYAAGSDAARKSRTWLVLARRYSIGWHVIMVEVNT